VDLLRICMDLLWICIGCAIDLYDLHCICCGFAIDLYDLQSPHPTLHLIRASACDAIWLKRWTLRTVCST
jgi:hypothetical protein